MAGYVGKIQGALGRELTWQTDDLALQNIQARVRAPGIWMLANVLNCLLITTSNRSEASVGYCTMDGDTAGSISPIAGVDKDFVKKWLRWAETELGYAALRHVNALQPTAELRPLADKQTDERDLMPYALLNRIERLAFYDRLSPRQVLAALEGEDTGFDHEQLKTYVRRFYSLWSRNQWKRERYAPSFHLDDYNVDPRSWLRFPILSGGFAEELAALVASKCVRCRVAPAQSSGNLTLQSIMNSLEIKQLNYSWQGSASFRRQLGLSLCNPCSAAAGRAGAAKPVSTLSSGSCGVFPSAVLYASDSPVCARLLASAADAEADLVAQLQAGQRSGVSHAGSSATRTGFTARFFPCCATPEEAEDVAQEVFVEVYQTIGRFRGEAALSTWLYRLATSRALKNRRRAQAKKRFAYFTSLLGFDNDVLHEPPDHAHPLALLEGQQQLQLLLAHIARLPDQQQVAFTLRHEQELSYERNCGRARHHRARRGIPAVPGPANPAQTHSTPFRHV